MKPSNLLCMLLLMVATLTLAQEKERKTGISGQAFSSQLMISTDFRDMYVNLVGSGIRYTRGDVMVAISLFPTLRFHEHHPEPDEDKRPFVTPGFSVGPLLQYKHLLLGFPSSYSYDYKWHFTVGTGYKFGK